jgi:hypothetical protein
MFVHEGDELVEVPCVCQEGTMTDEPSDFGFGLESVFEEEVGPPEWIVAVSSNGVITLSLFGEEGGGRSLRLTPGEARWIADLLNTAVPPDYE